MIPLTTSGGPLLVPDAAILLAALILDWIVGDMRWLFRRLPHPVAMVGGLIGLLERKLNRLERGETNRIVRGFVVVVIIVGLCAASGAAIERAAAMHPFGWAAELVLVVLMLAQRGLAGRVLEVGRHLKRREEVEARAALRHLVSRDPDRLDRHGVARSAIESLAENFSDAVVAPAFWYLVLGLPGLFAYKAINTLDSMIGYRTERYAAFGMTAARLDDAANWIPARLSGLIVVIAAVFAPTGRPAAALATMWKEARKHPSPNAGWPEAAMAGALDFALGGPRHYPGERTETVWIGGGRARLTGGDVTRAVTVFAIACAVLWLLVAAWVLYRYGV